MGLVAMHHEEDHAQMNCFPLTQISLPESLLPAASSTYTYTRGICLDIIGCRSKQFSQARWSRDEVGQCTVAAYIYCLASPSHQVSLDFDMPHAIPHLIKMSTRTSPQTDQITTLTDFRLPSDINLSDLKLYGDSELSLKWLAILDPLRNAPGWKQGSWGEK